MERINIHFHGQEISKEDQAQIKANLSYHLGDGPSDASICCCISKEKEGLAANLQVHSATGHTFIHRESHTLEQLLSYLYESMKLSFKNWHDNQKQFAKSHPMEKNPCRSASHKILKCPINAYAHASS